jgi:pyruvate dehydrogenase E2 component (dihydrolipoamide acetyltransferase)
VDRVAGEGIDMATIEVKVPPIGDFKDVPVIEVLVKPGETIAADAPLVTLESEKATMDVPSPSAGTIREVKVKAGDHVSEGSVVVTLDAGAAGGEAKPAMPAEQPAPAAAPGQASAATQGGSRATQAGSAARQGGNGSRQSPGATAAQEARVPATPQAGTGATQKAPDGAGAQDARAPATPQAGTGARQEAPHAGAAQDARAPATPPPAGKRAAPAGAPSTVEVKVPALGDFKDVPVIEVHASAGQTVKPEDPLVTIESEKATLDVPSPVAGTIRELKLKVGDRVSEGTLVAILEGAAAEETAPAAIPAPTPRAAAAPAEPSAPTAQRPEPVPTPAPAPPERATPSAPEAREVGAPVPHASPAIRALARELGVELARVDGTGPHRRILKEDVRRFVKQALSAAPVPAAGAGLELAPWPKVDFARFGPVERQPLSRIRKLSKGFLARNWVMIPHVTQFDEADVTELERFRQELNREQEKGGVKVTLLAFLVKACVAALRQFPELNASLDGDELVLKRYYHVGFAADTPNGLLVPVLRDADRKGVLELARELAELAAKAREGKLAPADIQGGSFSISSLGGIGGTAFTPIINAPEVAILGVSRSVTKPVWDGEKFAPRLILPLSLSYDHRVIDGALAARITTYLGQVLGDLRRAML